MHKFYKAANVPQIEKVKALGSFALQTSFVAELKLNLRIYNQILGFS
jgi:hypothetical protein